MIVALEPLDSIFATGFATLVWSIIAGEGYLAGEVGVEVRMKLTVVAAQVFRVDEALVAKLAVVGLSRTVDRSVMASVHRC